MTVSITTTGKQTLLAMVQQVAGEIGLTQPSFLVSNSDNSAIQFLALANRTAEEIAGQSGTWGGWPQLRREYTVTTMPGIDSYNFPADVQYLIPGTGWSRSFRWQLLGPLEAQEWQVLKSGISPTGPRTRWRIMGGKLYFDPVPSSAQNMAFEYYSNAWAQSASSAPQTVFLNDNDTFLLPDNLLVLGLKWRILRAKGLDYAQEFADYQAAMERAQSRAGSARSLPLNAQGRGIGLLSNNNIPDTGFGS